MNTIKKPSSTRGKIPLNRGEEKVMRNYGGTYLSFCCAAVLGISMQCWDDIQKSFLPKSLVLSAVDVDVPLSLIQN